MRYTQFNYGNEIWFLQQINNIGSLRQIHRIYVYLNLYKNGKSLDRSYRILSVILCEPLAYLASSVFLDMSTCESNHNWPLKILIAVKSYLFKWYVFCTISFNVVSTTPRFVTWMEWCIVYSNNIGSSRWMCSDFDFRFSEFKQGLQYDKLFLTDFI